MVARTSLWTWSKANPSPPMRGTRLSPASLVLAASIGFYAKLLVLQSAGLIELPAGSRP